MAAKKTQKVCEYGGAPKTIDDRPFYDLVLDDDQKKFVNAVLNPDNTIIFVKNKCIFVIFLGFIMYFYMFKN